MLRMERKWIYIKGLFKKKKNVQLKPQRQKKNGRQKQEKGNKKEQQKKVINVIDINPTISVITELSVA